MSESGTKPAVQDGLAFERPLNDLQTKIDELAALALQLCATAPWTATLWEHAAEEGWCKLYEPATDGALRRAKQTRIDLLVGRAYGLTHADVEWITRGEPFAKGFWRVERDLDPAARRPARWRRAASDDGGGAY